MTNDQSPFKRTSSLPGGERPTASVKPIVLKSDENSLRSLLLYTLQLDPADDDGDILGTLIRAAFHEICVLRERNAAIGGQQQPELWSIQRKLEAAVGLRKREVAPMGEDDEGWCP